MSKNVKKALFLVFVLVLFTTCSKNIKKCYMKPKISVNVEKKSESSTKSVYLNKMGAQLRCSF